MSTCPEIDPERDVAVASELRDPQEILAVILDPKRRGSLYPYLHRLREVGPILRTDQATGRPAWVLTRYADVREALKHPDVRSDERGVEVFDVGPEGRCFVEMQRNTLLFLPPAKHDRVRGLVSRAFTPRAVSEREGRIRSVLDGLIDRVLARGRMDLVHDFAFQLPVVVICEMLGVPTEDLPRFYDWAHDSTRRGTEQRTRDGVTYSYRYFDFDGHRVWGATAMMLGEFAELFSDSGESISDLTRVVRT